MMCIPSCCSLDCSSTFLVLTSLRTLTAHAHALSARRRIRAGLLRLLANCFKAVAHARATGARSVLFPICHLVPDGTYDACACAVRVHAPVPVVVLHELTEVWVRAEFQRSL